MMVQPPQTHNHGNMKTMGRIDTSGLMMLIRLVRNISFRSSGPEWDSWTHTALYIANTKKVTETINNMWETLAGLSGEPEITQSSAMEFN